jgi:hypothetical protein
MEVETPKMTLGQFDKEYGCINTDPNPVESPVQWQLNAKATWLDSSKEVFVPLFKQGQDQNRWMR